MKPKRLRELANKATLTPEVVALTAEIVTALEAYAALLESRVPSEASDSLAERCAPFLDALVGYIDGFYGIAIHYKIPARDAADYCKHMHSAVIGIKRRLGLPITDPTPSRGGDVSRDPPGLRVGAKPGEAQATARKTPVETASLPHEPPAAPPFNALLNFAEWCLGAPEEAEHMVAHIKANARYAIDQWNSVTKTRHPAMNCPHCDGITPRGVLEHAPGCPAKDGHQ